MFIVAIAGISGSGKTSLSDYIHSHIDSTIISLDNFYKSNISNHDLPLSFDFDLFFKSIHDLITNGETIIPFYNFETHTVTHNIYVKSNKILILEGIYVLYDSRIANLCNLKLYLDIDYDIALIRRIKRDILERGRSINTIQDKYVHQVKPNIIKYQNDEKLKCDIIIPNHLHKKNFKFIINIIKQNI